MASSLSQSTVLFSILILISLLLSIHQTCAKKAHLNLYFHEIRSGPNATVLTTVNAPNTTAFTRGVIAVIDDMLREGYDDNSKLIGRAQGLVAVVGFDNSLETMVNFVFTDGKYNGSSLAMFGRVVVGATIERAVIGGTGIFKVAQGYSVGKPVYISDSKLIYEFDVYVWYDEIN